MNTIAQAVAIARTVEGYMSEDELAALASIASSLPPRSTWIEVGFYMGRSATAVLMALPPLSRLVIVDHLRFNLSGVVVGADGEARSHKEMRRNVGAWLARVMDFRPNASIEFHITDSVNAASNLPDGCADVVFLDGDHDEASLRADTAAWLPKVRSDGLLTGHDYSQVSCPDVKRVVDELFGDRACVVAGTVWKYRRPPRA